MVIYDFCLPAWHVNQGTGIQIKWQVVSMDRWPAWDTIKIKICSVGSALCKSQRVYKLVWSGTDSPGMIWEKGIIVY